MCKEKSVEEQFGIPKIENLKTWAGWRVALGVNTGGGGGVLVAAVSRVPLGVITNTGRAVCEAVVFIADALGAVCESTIIWGKLINITNILCQ